MDLDRRGAQVRMSSLEDGAERALSGDKLPSRVCWLGSGERASAPSHIRCVRESQAPDLVSASGPMLTTSTIVASACLFSLSARIKRLSSGRSRQQPSPGGRLARSARGTRQGLAMRHRCQRSRTRPVCHISSSVTQNRQRRVPCAWQICGFRRPFAFLQEALQKITPYHR